MALEEVIRRPVYVQVAEQLREAILDGTFPSGTDLPSERELCERLGVGRTTVREALRALQAQGLVVSGGATAPPRVAAPQALSTGPVRDALVHLLRLGAVPLRDLVELRCALEGEAAAAAARRRANPEALAAARAELDAMREAGAGTDVEAFEAADVRFHLAVSAAGGNEAVHLVMLAVRDSIATHLLEALRALEDPGPTLKRLLHEHHGILEAIEGRDPEGAERLMRDHVRGFYRRAMQ